MTMSKSLKELGVYPIMVGGCLHGHHEEYENRPDGGLESMKESHCTLTNFVLPSDLQQCRELGLKAIVMQATQSWHKTREISDYFSQEELDRRAKELVEACRPYKDTVLAYYIFDEPSVRQFDYIKSIIHAIRQYDTETSCFVNLYPSHAKLTQLGVDEHAKDPFGEYLQRFYDVVQPNDFIRYDNFTISHVQGDGSDHDIEKLQCYYSDLLQVRDFALSKGLQAWNTVCCCQIRPHATIPTPANLAFQAHTTLAAGFKGIGWYSYYKSARPNAEGRYLYEYAPFDILAGHQRTATFYYLQEVNRQVRIYGDRLLPMTSTGVYFRNTHNFSIDAMNMGEGTIVKDVISDENFPAMIGEFRDEHEDSWFMLVNLDMQRTMKIRLHLQDGYTGLEHVSLGTGNLLPTDSESPIHIPPGSGYLYKALR